MSNERNEQERDARNRERSREAHWQAAEAGAGESDAPPEASLEPGERANDEDESAAPDQGTVQEGTSETRRD